MSDIPKFDPSKPFTRETPKFDPSKPFTREGDASSPAKPSSILDTIWNATKSVASKSGDIIESMWNTVGSGGNLLGIPGKNALDRSAEFDVPYKPGMTAGQMIPPNWQQNPMLGAFGAGNIGRMMGPRNPAATARLQDFEGQGVTPSVPAVGQGRATGLAAQAGRILPFSPVQRGIAQNTVETQAATERAAAQYGTAADEFAGGNVARNAMTRFAADKSQAASDYGTFFGHMQGAPDAPIPNTLRVLSDLKGRFPNAP